MLTRYGTNNIIIMLILGVILLAVGIIFFRHWYSYPIGLLGLLLVIFTFVFFRDPDRTIPREAIDKGNIIVSPADGKVVQIIDIDEPNYLQGKAKQISIFLSPLDVHVNRIPLSGVIEYFKYHPGEYLVAYHPKSSLKNEQTHIGLNSKYGKILFKQIVGMVARRLVWDIKEGDTVEIGQRFGMMKFGSRMDVIVPPDTEIKVSVDDVVTGGETVLAALSKKDS